MEQKLTFQLCTYKIFEKKTEFNFKIVTFLNTSSYFEFMFNLTKDMEMISYIEHYNINVL